MRFTMIMKADENSEAGLPPDPRLFTEIAKFTEVMVKEGVVLATGGLGPSANGSRIFAADGKLTTLDGPFAETKELVAGFAIIEAASKEEAIMQGKRFLKVHQDVLGPSWQGCCEVRELFGPGDCDPAKT